ncbi:hypothetical protein F53441_14552 [Fusarium austroafricanum]|uniref:Uncharacterized protein n=1 Tax=Fusarium austroafricanum TaxID=2364996 RepID=A0A8H4NEL3_9HYPO|nr:hypothetical protein F53441_14552 [Fusarium austroafricanum]
MPIFSSHIYAGDYANECPNGPIETRSRCPSGISSSATTATTLGDSITQGAYSLHSELTMRYVRRLDVLNRGLGGYNTNSALALLSMFFQAVASRTVPRVAVMTVHLGSDNSFYAGEPQHCDLDRFESNIGCVLSWEDVRLLHDGLLPVL